MTNNIAYFDNCATTRVDEEVLSVLNRYHMQEYFNPSARSSYSLKIANDLASARSKIAKLLGATDASEIYFTSGGTESDNIAICGCLRARKGNVVVTQAEHSAVYNTVVQLAGKGYEVRMASVTPDGHIDVDDFVAKVDDNTLLACFMHVNNETGAVNDVKLINKLVKEKNPRTVTFSDGVQAVGKVKVNLRNLGVDLYSFSGHKIHCSKGTGVLYVSKNCKVNALVQGGGQERGLRSGTEYVGGCVALATALQLATSLVDDNTSKYLHYKDIIRTALADVADWKENCTENCSPAIMSLAFCNIKGEVLLHMLEQHGIIVGTGSACSSQNKQSRIAKAIALGKDYSEGLIRLSFSKYNSADEVTLLASKLRECVLVLRKTILNL